MSISCNSIYQQKQVQSTNPNPPMRLNMISPYKYSPGSTSPIFSQFQLNMRRKVEILKYANSNSQQNQITKSQLYASLSNRGGSLSQYAIRHYPNSVCDVNKNIATPNSACDVPGPLMYLQNDPTVPLYNYNDTAFDRVMSILPPTDSYAFKAFSKNINNDVNLLKFMFVSDNNSSLTSYTQKILYTSCVVDIGFLQIGDLINSGNYTFSLSCPIGFTMVGYVDQSHPDYYVDGSGNPGDPPQITIDLDNIDILVYYNQSIVKTIPVTSSQTQLDSVTFNIKDLSLVPGGFYVSQYIGTINLTNIELIAQPGFIYEIKLSINYHYDSSNLNSSTPIIIPGTPNTIFYPSAQTGFINIVSPDFINIHNNANLISSPHIPFTPGNFTLYDSTV
jgi:hypothetical protein